MVTDVFDSKNFHPGKEHDDARLVRYQHAYATILSHLIFREEPLMLTIPQLYDGYFSTYLSGDMGMHSLDRRKEMLFKLMIEGHIQICIYNPDSYGVHNVWEYMEKIPFKNPNYEYSSMPILYNCLQDGNHKMVQRQFENVKAYILALGKNEKKDKNFIYDVDVYGNEMNAFLDFMTEFREVEQACGTELLYRPFNVQLPEFNTMLKTSLGDPEKTCSLLSLTSAANCNELLQLLLDCKTRSECNTLINGEKFAALSDQVRMGIRDVISVIYNKHSLSAFPKAVIHAPQSFNEARKNLLKEIIETKVENENTVTLSSKTENAYTFWNTEILQENAPDRTILTLEDALEMREEIKAIRSEKVCSWQEAVQQFRMKHVLNELRIEDDGCSFSMSSSGGKTISYTSVPEFDFNKALQFDRISDLIAHTHSYSTKD